MNVISIPGFAEPVNSLSHLVTAGVFLVLGTITLHRGRGDIYRVLGLLIYSFFAVVLFSLSGVFHLLERGTTASYVMQILDHAAIFTMIAGSFTPFHIILLRGHARWLPLLIIWPLAIAGLTLTAIYFGNLPEALILSFFLGMGWMGLFTVLSVSKVTKTPLRLMLAGAFLYTFGAVADFFRWPLLIEGVLASHEFFHLCIVAAAICHWKAIHDIADHPVGNELFVVVKEEQPQLFSAYVHGRLCITNASSKRLLKIKLLQWLKEHYPKPLLPTQLKFQFVKEELVKLKR